MSDVSWQDVLNLARSPERVPLRAGAWSLVFEGGDLRTLSWNGTEVIRRIYGAIRDRNWGTVPGRLSDVLLESDSDGFQISFTSEHVGGGVDFVWRATISGGLDGEIRYAFDGEARSNFLRNRIGLCVLHPLSCASKRYRIKRLDGTSANGFLPRAVEPAQPVPGIHDLGVFSHEVATDVWAEVAYRGDRFEMEDQRNWIDASFKTYGTPLSEPYPVEILAGTRVRQEVRLRLLGTPDSAGHTHVRSRDEATIEIVVGRDRTRVPAMGVALGRDGSLGGGRARERLRGLKLQHLRTDVRLTRSGWEDRLRTAASEATALTLPLELAVHFPPESLAAAAKAFGAAARALDVGVVRVLPFLEGADTLTAESLAAIRTHIGLPDLPIGVGTDADFFQLNHARPPHAQADFVHWSMNPQVHAFDVTSLVETPAAVRDQLASAKKYFADKPQVVSPVTLQPRFNPVATTPDGGAKSADPRLVTPLAAAWTLAMLKHLGEGGAASVTFFETVGPHGVMASERDDRSDFPARPGQVYPLFYALGEVASCAGGSVISCQSSAPLLVEAAVLESASSTRIVMANLTDTTQEVRVSGVRRLSRVLMFDWSELETWMFEPDAYRRREARKLERDPGNLALPPHALMRIEVES